MLITTSTRSMHAAVMSRVGNHGLGWIVEREEYALHFFYLSLGSTRGDV
jgi:hypothetical protein